MLLAAGKSKKADDNKAQPFRPTSPVIAKQKKRPKSAAVISSKVVAKDDDKSKPSAHQKKVYEELTQQRDDVYRSFHNVHNKSDCLPPDNRRVYQSLIATNNHRYGGTSCRRQHVRAWQAVNKQIMRQRARSGGKSTSKRTGKRAAASIDVTGENVSHHMKLESLCRPTVASRLKHKPSAYVTEKAVAEELSKSRDADEERVESERAAYSDDDFENGTLTSMTSSRASSEGFGADDSRPSSPTKPAKQPSATPSKQRTTRKANSVDTSVDTSTQSESETDDTETSATTATDVVEGAVSVQQPIRRDQKLPIKRTYVIDQKRPM